jgi:hypothetical protein
MIRRDHVHTATTHQAAVELDEDLRAWAREHSWSSSAGSITELVQLLRQQGDYWERAQTGRLQAVRRALARLLKPFVTPQIRYNLLIADMLGRVEVALAELREAREPSDGADEDAPPTRPRQATLRRERAG